MMQRISKALGDFCAFICCQVKAVSPDPYDFQFGTEESRKDNSLRFMTNEITTTKYNMVNFLPKSILLQYKRMANFYFLVVATLTTVPTISPLNPALIWLGVFSVLAVSILKEGYEDYCRYKIDKDINSQKTTKVFRDGALMEVAWGQLQVGDVCLVQENQYFPADMLLISTCQDDGIAYIQTASLDGQKTSKIRYAFDQLSHTYKSVSDMAFFSGKFEGESPSDSLDTFRGNLTVRGQRFNIVDNKQLLYRGAKLMNTEKVWGLIIYAGQCSKIMLNSQISCNKISVVQKRVNVMLVTLFIFQVAFCAVTATLNMSMDTHLRATTDYIIWSQRQPNQVTQWVVYFFMFFIEYSTIIPISLIVSVEIVKLAQSYFIDFDKLMYSQAKQRGVLAKNTVLNEELGQIQYVFTDKTGTLTSNKMTFHTAVIGDSQYEFEASPDAEKYNSLSYQRKMLNQDFQTLSTPIQLISDDGRAKTTLKMEQQIMHHYLMALLVCNTINVVIREDKSIYESQSPDQIALIKMVRSLKYVFIKRQSNSVTVQINGKTTTIRVLQRFAFNSDRKRMSVLVQINQNIFLYIKGADNVISQRIKPTEFAIDERVSQLSRKGLRTLMVAMKLVSQNEYEEFRKVINSTELASRDEVFAEFASKFEDNLTLVGATALLDQLQSGVPQTLRDFQRADIRVWMLTGDKLETAIEVSKSCNLIARNYEILECRPGVRPIQDFLEQWDLIVTMNPSKSYSLVIEGARLAQIIKSQEYSAKFANLSINFKTVICCRLLPIQKAHTVRLIKKNLDKICLAIGDGGNDVSMIKQAHIGVGLYGQEGMSAVQASDYAIPQFRMIWRLMFVHGRWNYLRISQMILYFTYKSILFTMPRIVFAYYSAYSGQPIYDDYYIALYNVIFTSLPLLIRALFEQDVNYVVKDDDKEEKIKERVDLKMDMNDVLAAHQIENIYLRGTKLTVFLSGSKNHEIFNFANCAFWIGQSVGIGAISTLLVLFIIGSGSINSDGYNPDLWMCSITVFSIVIVVNSIKIAMHVRHWTKLFMFSLFGCSLGPYLVYVWISNWVLSQHVEGTPIMCFSSFLTYCVVIFTSVISVVVLSIFLYFTFHRNKMLKKITLRMSEIKDELSDTMSMESKLAEETFSFTKMQSLDFSKKRQSIIPLTTLLCKVSSRSVQVQQIPQ